LVLEHAPGNRRTLMLKGKLQIVKRELGAAEATYKEMIQKNPEDAPAHVMLGLVYNLAGRQPEATTEYRKALELNPRQMEAFDLLVNGYLRDKNYEEALALCNAQEERMQGETSLLARVEYMKGRVSIEAQDSARAEKHFAKAIEIDPNQIPAYAALAELFIRENRSDEARQQYEKILEKNPDYLPAYIFLGSLSAEEGDLAKAESYYRQALKRKPDFAPAANNLAWQIAESGENLAEALTLAQTAKKQLPDSAAVSDTLGWIYLNLKAYTSAIAELTQSASLEPQNPVIHYHLGLAYARNDQPAEARASLQRALEIDPHFQGADEARRVLDEIAGEQAGSTG